MQRGTIATVDSHEHRLRRAAGKSYPDLIRMRSGAVGAAPDAIFLPTSAEQVAVVLRACANEGVAVVPFGGGTSVVGGVTPLAGDCERVISLDLRRMRTVDVDRRSLTATLGPGLRGPEAEEALAAQGMTLGHFPQSFEYATIGGFAATRSAGQASSGYGRFDDLVTADSDDGADRRAAHARDAAYGRGAIAARARSRLRRGSRRDHRGHRSRATGTIRAALRGLDRRGLRRRP